MSPLILGAVLFAALLHAVWNALIKVSGDRLVVDVGYHGNFGAAGGATAANLAAACARELALLGHVRPDSFLVYVAVDQGV